MDQLLEQLRELLAGRNAELRERFQRDLPFADAVFDRWERARRLGFAEGASIYDSSLVFGEVQVGQNTWIGPFTLLDGSAGLRIGDHCSISAGVHIYTHDTVAWALSRGVAGPRLAPVSIGDGCHIGAQSVIMPGVTIGSRCVIGANSFVNRDVPDRTVAAGSPAKPIARVRGEGKDIRIEHLDGTDA